MDAKVCHNKARFWDSKTKRCRPYKTSDFKLSIHTGDVRSPYMFRSKDKNVEASFFWQPGDVELRGLYGDVGIIHIAYPVAGGTGKPTTPDIIGKSLIKRLREIK